jgi:hypothetical protein
MLMAGLDGIENHIDPGKPIDKNLYDLPPAEAKVVKSTPGSLQQALGRYGAATRDFSAAEQELELLDLRTDAIGVLGSYQYSDSDGYPHGYGVSDCHTGGRPRLQ